MQAEKNEMEMVGIFKKALSARFVLCAWSI